VGAGPRAVLWQAGSNMTRATDMNLEGIVSKMAGPKLGFIRWSLTRTGAPGPRARTTATGGSLWRQDTLGNAMPVARLEAPAHVIAPPVDPWM
jgi:hypothetical protein